MLGYIFEKYINQKQMGAYYTKEDITGYITRNTIVPFLFDAAKKECPVAFTPSGGVWRLLRDDPDRYIYPSVGHGISHRYSPDTDPVPLEQALDLPGDIAKGIVDVSKRDGWNSAAPEDYALPTETWREVVARRQRYAEIHARLASGEIEGITELITLNLDIERFARDVIAQSEGPELLRAFWNPISNLSVLDPTCGSGAFLFAALNILEPLYTTCLEGMQGFLDDMEVSQRRRHRETLSDFQDTLDLVDSHPSQRYFILKSIVLHNLYGVDIMEEAVEICKLRLFLKLVAQLDTYDQIEPLPDIDFNIRTGNTLVGFTSMDSVHSAMTLTETGQHRSLFEEEVATLARMEIEAEEVSQLFNAFRKQQTELGGSVTSVQKLRMRNRLNSLRDELDHYLASEYKVNAGDSRAFTRWRNSHRPLHWFVEFHAIMSGGGFDVVVGNPPYVKSNTLNYDVKHLGNSSYSDIYAHMAIQSRRISSDVGRCGMIVPLSLSFSFEFSDLREELSKTGSHWFSSYDNIPAALFTGVGQRCTIWISAPNDGDSHVSRLFRWRSAYRDCLMDNVTYVKLPDHVQTETFGIPRLPNSSSSKLMAMHTSFSTSALSIKRAIARSSVKLGFSQTGRNFLSTFIEPPPVLDVTKHQILASKSCGWLSLSSGQEALVALAATSGDSCFWYWLTRGDGFHVTNWLLDAYLAPIASFPLRHFNQLAEIGEMLHEQRSCALVFKKNAGKFMGNYNYQKLRHLTLRADLIFLSGLGASWFDLQELFSYVSRVRSINAEAGEKNIPETLRDALPIEEIVDWSSDGRLHNIDDWLSTIYSVDKESIESLLLA